jgi:hypothetical protein
VGRGRFSIGSDALPFTAPQFDLLSTATQLDLPQDSHWRMGIRWEPLCPEANGTYDPCLVTPWLTEDAPEPKTATTEWQVRAAVPFTVYSQIDCSPVGTWDQLSSRNQQSLIRAEARIVENAFWTGSVYSGADQTVFPHLASEIAVSDGGDLIQPQVTVPTFTAQEIAVGIGMLEDAMRDCYPGVATIHLPIRLAALAAEHDLIAPRSGVMYTTSIGSKVIIGDYPGTAPDGTAPPAGTTWVYATGEVFFARDREPRGFRPVESLDRNVNTVSMIAERTYVLGWDCCLIGIPILNGEL